MGQKVYRVPCPYCGGLVKMNGAGSDSNWFNRAVSATLGVINPITTNLFRRATDRHDMDYHIGPMGDETPEEGQLRADESFLENMHLAIEDPKGQSDLGVFNRGIVKSAPWWFEYQAWKYYKAVRWKGHEVYPQHNCTSQGRKFLDDDVIFE